MKKQLKSQLVSIAHRILQMRDGANYTEMQREAKEIYDTLTVLAFAEKHFDGINPTIGKAQIIEVLQEKEESVVNEIIEAVTEEKHATAPEGLTLRIEDNVKRLEEIAKANELIFQKAREKKAEGKPKVEQDNYRPSGMEKNINQNDLHEPVIEKIKDMVAMMPPEADAIDDMFQEITQSKKPFKNDMKDVGEYGRIAEFEEKETLTEIRQKSLNDRLNKGLTIGLNDRIAFIKHLFNGSAADYNRVLSQLNTHGNKKESILFIDTMVKPDYGNWENKEVYEARFKDLVDKKFEA